MVIYHLWSTNRTKKHQRIWIQSATPLASRYGQVIESLSQVVRPQLLHSSWFSRVRPQCNLQSTTKWWSLVASCSHRIPNSPTTSSHPNLLPLAGLAASWQGGIIPSCIDIGHRLNEWCCWRVPVAIQAWTSGISRNRSEQFSRIYYLPKKWRSNIHKRLVTFLNTQRHSSLQTDLKFLAFYERQNCGGRFYCPLPHMLGALSATVPWLRGLPEQRSVQRSSAVDVPAKASKRNPRHLGNTKKEYWETFFEVLQ